MDYRTWHLRLAPNSAAFVELHPTEGFEEAWESNVRHQRTLGGRLHTARPGGEALRYTLPLDFVSSETRAAVDSYWRSDAELALTINLSEDDAVSVRVQITNRNAPLPFRTPGQTDRFAGNLFLRQVRPDGKAAGGPFILDDGTWGLLDQDYNPLL